MQRYHGTSCTSAVNNGAIGGVSARDRVDQSSLPTNFSLNQRRQPQPAFYKLRCDKEPLNSRLGPPDFNPQTPNCPEETLNREYVQSGYRETIEGLEEAREISLSQVQIFSKPVISKCKEAIRKCHRAINESRAQKRKAGQVYGVPLSGQLLTKHGVFPEQRPCGEDSRRKWIEGLSQPHKRLRSLADHVPHGYRKEKLFDVLIKNNVPLLRATWFIKVTYLNQVRPISISISSGVPDKTRVSRTEQWTKDVIDYLQSLLDEVYRHGSHSNLHTRDRLPQVAHKSLQHKSGSTSALLDGEEPSLHFRWWYLVRIIQWHHTEELLHPAPIIDWVLSQLQEKDLLGNLQLLLPILYGLMETVILSQTYVRAVVGLAIRFIQEPSPSSSDLVYNSRRAYTTSALIEMLRYMIHSVPDTFVALDCFPLPSSVISYVVNDGNFLLKDNTAKTDIVSEVGCFLKSKGLEAQCRSLAVNRVVSSIRQRASNLAVATRPGCPSHNVAKALQKLDKALVHGDGRIAYNFLFEDLYNGAIDEGWMAGVSQCLRASLKCIGTLRLPFVCSVFLLCEWATCDFRDIRTAPPHGMKFSGRKDFSQVYLAVRILKLKMEDLQRTRKSKKGRGPRQLNNALGSTVTESKYDSSVRTRRKERSNPYESPGPLHDIITCWIDQHEVHTRGGFKRLQLLIIELIRACIFCPLAYVRQLIVSGTMDSSGPVVDMERKRRHYKVLKHLPGPHVNDLLKDAQTAVVPLLSEAMNVYSNERRLLLQRLTHARHSNGSNSSSSEACSLSMSSKSFKSGELEELKDAISVLLQFPSSSAATGDTSGDSDNQGSLNRTVGSKSYKMDSGEGTPGCEECRKAKRPKLSEERNSYLQDYSHTQIDEEDIWWMRKGMKLSDVLKTDPPANKPVKQASRGRQKAVRKTQSLAQLAAARIESSQGASSSHVCDSKVSCPQHRPGLEGELPKSKEGSRTLHSGDIVLIAKKLKQLQFVVKRIVAVWLVNSAKQLIEESEKSVAKVGQYNRTFPSVDDKSSVRWKLGEDELSAILYLLDVSDDLVSAVMFLLWLLPRVLGSSSSTIHGGRNVLMQPRNVGSHVCQVGEAFLLSSVRRYENILVANDLLPETLSAMMRRVVTLMASNGRVSGSAALVYARYLLKKYNGLPSIVEWEKNFKATCDKRLIPELQSGKSLDGELGFPLGVPAGVEDLDDFLRQKISSVRVSRVGMSMREVVQRHVEEAFQYICGKERKVFPPNTMKSHSLEKGDDGYQFAQQVVISIMDCMRQTGGAAQEGDPSLVSSAISAIVGSISQVLVKLPDLTVNGNHANVSPTMGSFTIAQRMLRFHVTCLSLLKEALGDRQSRVYEIALAVEASLALSQALAPGKINEIPNSSMKTVSGRAVKAAAGVSALVVAAIVHGVASLERMVTVFRLKEGLDLIQFARSTRSNSNGNVRSGGVLKADTLVEVSVHWFRVLVGNCRTVCDGLILELLGETSVVALSRIQRALPVSLVVPPAYSIFAFVIWRPFLFNPNISNRDGIHQLNQSFALAINEIIKHLPFRDVFFRETRGFYDLVAADTTDSEFASMLELNGAEMHLKKMAFVPLRARLFLNAVIDCKLPACVFAQDDAKRVLAENESKLPDRLVHILDTLQPAKFHWQWVELRLLLNEQALIEKLDDTPIAESIRAISLNPDKAAASENENNFIEIILPRLLVRPDAAALFSEVIHLLGKSLEDSMLLQVKWFLKGSDVLFGRKSIRQRLINIAEIKGLSTKPQNRKPWGWCNPDPANTETSMGNKRKFESLSHEEGEVVEVGTNSKRSVRGPTQSVDSESFNASQQYVTERALIELVLSCVDQSSDESRNIFAGDLIKQMSDIEQQISAVTRGAGKQVGAVNCGIEAVASKSSGRKATRGGSPGLSRRQTVTADIVPPTPGALRASMALRLQFLFRLLPIIWADGEPSVRNMRHMLASVILRLLGSRVVHEDADMPLFTASTSFLKKDVDFTAENLSGGSLFDSLLLMLHGLLSTYRPSWLKSKKETSPFDRDVIETFQNDLDRMHLPDAVRWRIQAAMPILFPSFRRSISCQPPSVPPSALSSLLPIIPSSGSPPGNSNLPLRNQSLAGKNKLLPAQQQQDGDMEIDPWMLLEDGVVSGQSLTSSTGISGGDNGNFKASGWLKGAVRMRRTDLTYIGSIDDDS